MMTHTEAVTPSLTGGMALFTLIGYIVVYSLVFSAGAYYLMRVLYLGLEEPDHEEPDTDRPARPLSAAHVSFEYNSDTADHKGGH
jgi:cytochrome d ubiquinol oxidase subunit I